MTDGEVAEVADAVQHLKAIAQHNTHLLELILANLEAEVPSQPQPEEGT